MAPSAPGKFCPRCGAMNPPDYNFCGQCHLPLPGGSVSSPAGTPIATFPPVGVGATIDVGRRAGGLIFVWIGVGVLVLGIGLLVGAAIEQQSVANYNSGCSRIAFCTPASDPSGAIAIAGGLFTAMGVGFLALGGYQYAYRAG